MKKSFLLAGLALALAVGLPTVVSKTAHSDQTGPAAVNAPAPEVSLGNTIGGDGRTALADFRGEVVFLEFWGTH